MEVSELPDSFEDALNIAVECTRSAFETGNNRVRVDFDTTAGDQTYTTLKNSLPLVCVQILISLRTESARAGGATNQGVSISVCNTHRHGRLPRLWARW